MNQPETPLGPRHPVALTIAGSDPSGGAGMQADLKTLHAFGVYGSAVVTLLTVQNTQGVEAVEMLQMDFFQSQFDCVTSDIPPDAVKTGALGTAEMIATVAAALSSLKCPIVVDPVMISKHGHAIIDDGAVDALRTQLLPVASLVTPNRFEAERLAETSIESEDDLAVAATRLHDQGVPAVLIKAQFDNHAVDFLSLRSGQSGRPETQTWTTQWIDGGNLHGTGCVLSAAITAGLASQKDLVSAIERARRFVTAGIASPYRIGRGVSAIDVLEASKKTIRC
ncbi:bifunctional hydroxymethylpyrimidine kinase/phosphomethylpyrimidine kinase [Crateriforma conspicua]|uniref:hydroxymethylpyrimidine kinase n=1 Tax=Crateriforma conspicua TaxID=2527996 RepID=A0A5C5XXA8_9PLAN|nr:bifunctional hydroxymethylpyrimidine kinase/phosphomethylpyrimidine kinase [Crateriforma conspicua]QDV63183.1 Hydroxymethylpyrimidine/phosphomethylpyrimidine kinase [Crateriforma conspicua]TWT68046.1 Hydroxymethylpyrimidine/phosphomethylpyrimidine kinase [Crateriforma conspicua]